MLSQLDHIIFPDRCEVYELVPSQRYVYPIFKNGRSSFSVARQNNKNKIFINEQIKKLKSIDVVLRDPESRVISGINTFIQLTIQDNPTLDVKTVKWFCENYLFLNRHYSTQFSWLVNLARYTSNDAKMNFYSMADLSKIVTLNNKPSGIDHVTEDFSKSVVLKDFEMYQRIDQSLIDCCMHKSMTFKEVVLGIKNSDPDAFDFVVEKTMKVLTPLHNVLLKA